ncbi:tRNA epoxyqueuosine(34) reductase QueG [Acidimicrobiales bacterium]|nr:tRNA epoxyqueuosine(34) reductase QueG [bacterium]MDB4103732.1 tRNA epoxyqueuosine(34) reductase QueG [Acidimicrobiales bacterium]
MSSTAELRRIGLAAGLTAVGFTHAEPFTEARVTLVERKAAGLHGGMQFTYRNPERSTTPTRILESAQSLIVGAWPYRAPDPHVSTDRPQAEIAAYAWRDHYGSLKSALGEIAAALQADGYTARVVADDNALVDRAAAIRAGVGWAGKNSNVLVPGHGSWFVLGAVVTDAPLEHDQPVEPACGSCRRCLDGCPTGAIIAEGVVDARRCLAWLLQADGDFPIEFREALGTRIYGCDDCQVVCPPSRGSDVGMIGDEVTSLDLLELLTMDDEALLAAVGRWYIPKRDLRYVRRNALVALGNANISGDNRTEAMDVLASYIGSDDMLAEHARWAADQLDASTPH